MPKAKAPVLFPFHPITGSLYVEEPFNSHSHGYWNDGRNHHNHAHWANDFDANIDWARQRGDLNAARKLEEEKNNGLASGELTFSPVKANLLPHFVLEAKLYVVDVCGPGRGSAVLILRDIVTKSDYPMLVNEARELMIFATIDRSAITNNRYWGFVKTNNRYGIKAVG